MPEGGGDAVPDVLTKTERSELMNCLLDMGQMLLNCGAEVSRVEDTLSRMAKAYGCTRVEVFVITSVISLSMEFPDEEVFTEMKRIYSSSDTNFVRLENLNSISRRCCARPMPVPELREKLQCAAAEEKPYGAIFAGSAIAAGAFAVFFGGSLSDGFSAALFAVVICMLQTKLGDTQITQAGANLLISFLTGIGVGLFCLLVPEIHMDKILIGDIMLLIPGLAMTNSIRNMLGGNTISGLIRLTESLIWAAALAGGFMTAMLLIDLVLGGAGA